MFAYTFASQLCGCVHAHASICQKVEESIHLNTIWFRSNSNCSGVHYSILLLFYLIKILTPLMVSPQCLCPVAILYLKSPLQGEGQRLCSTEMDNCDVLAAGNQDVFFLIDGCIKRNVPRTNESKTFFSTSVWLECILVSFWKQNSEAGPHDCDFEMPHVIFCGWVDPT